MRGASQLRTFALTAKGWLGSAPMATPPRSGTRQEGAPNCTVCTPGTRPDQRTDIEMTESLTPGCGLSVAPGSDEDTPRRPPVRDTEELGQDTYGPLKVACEDDVLARYGSRATIVRPGKVAGPFDPQDGLTWARRAALGGRVALPGAEDQPVQIIDSRDLGRLVVQLIADDRPGAFHAVGPAEPVTLGGLIRTCARVAGTQAEVVPVPAEAAPPFFPLIRADWPSQQRSAARARAAGCPPRRWR